MSIGRALAALTTAVFLDSLGAASNPPDSETRAMITPNFQSTDTFPSFDRALLLEQTSETSANVSIGDVDGDSAPVGQTEIELDPGSSRRETPREESTETKLGKDVATLPTSSMREGPLAASASTEPAMAMR